MEANVMFNGILRNWIFLTAPLWHIFQLRWSIHIDQARIDLVTFFPSWRHMCGMWQPQWLIRSWLWPWFRIWMRCRWLYLHTGEVEMCNYYVWKSSHHFTLQVMLDYIRENVQIRGRITSTYYMVPWQNPISFLFLPPYSSGLCLVREPLW
jgi:hypothetical protein